MTERRIPHDMETFQKIVDDVNGRLKEITSENHIAILCGAWIEKALDNLLNAFLRNAQETFAMLSGKEGSTSYFSQLAYCMELISEPTFKNINRINKIRNRFAHAVRDYSFEDNEIKTVVGEFDFSDIAYPGSGLETHLLSLRTNDRLGIFKFVTGEIVWEITHEAENIARIKKILQDKNRCTSPAALHRSALAGLEPPT